MLEYTIANILCFIFNNATCIFYFIIIKKNLKLKKKKDESPTFGSIFATFVQILDTNTHTHTDTHTHTQIHNFPVVIILLFHVINQKKFNGVNLMGLILKSFATI